MVLMRSRSSAASASRSARSSRSRAAAARVGGSAHRRVTELLPGANCGACGYAGCRAFAEAPSPAQSKPAQCTVMGEPERADVAAYLGVDAGAADKRVARLLCAGGSDVAPRKATYRGIESCAAAVAVGGGGKGCAWGCVGLGDCAVACTFDAIR
jgi:Na+-translocating ferredoxin:NAD+ oxidoreductase subunit B